MDTVIKRVPLILIGVVILLGLLFVGFGLWFGSANQAEYVLTADRIPEDQVVDHTTANLTTRESNVVEEAFRNRSATTVGTRLAIDGAYVARNQSLYRVDVTKNTTVRRERFVVTFTPSDESDRTGEPVLSLPDVDSDKVAHAHRQIQNEDRQTEPRFVYRDRAAANESVLVTGTVQYVRIQNVTLRVNVTRENVSLETYQYSMTQVAANETAAVELLVHHPTEELSEEELRPIAEAVETGEFRSSGRTHESAWQPLAPVAKLCGIEPKDFVNQVGTADCYVGFEGDIYRLSFDGNAHL